MKIEIAESLFYSWLRHVKSCQIVQTNWKLSKQWELKREVKDKLESFMKELDSFFKGKYKYQIFKQNASLEQLLNQGECDALGIRLNAENQYDCYAVDVAFHENGLKYGEKDVTVMKVVEKCVRTAFCLYGYFNTSNAEILFASPKIFPSVCEPLDRCIDDLNDFFRGKDLAYNFSLVANDDFNEKVIVPTLKASEGMADSTELFIRSYKLLTLFANEDSTIVATETANTNELRRVNRDDEYNGMKIGEIANTILREILESGIINDEEIQKLQNKEYSKEKFHINYPLLVHEGSNYDKIRYYSREGPLCIKGVYYYLCSQWVERTDNNDRPYLLRWIREHKQ
ncbi:MAG: hypothetical protein KBT32_03605 [Bacteroidales bacterium]|nr:hypothetical protein [Candidatus Physcocola equi]